jgi:hypothetical protein
MSAALHVPYFILDGVGLKLKRWFELKDRGTVSLSLLANYKWITGEEAMVTLLKYKTDKEI